MKDLLIFLAQSMVDHPEAVEVIETVEGDSILLKLRVAEEDMGKVIGKQGKIAKSIRTLIKAAAAKQGVRVSVDIMR